MQMRGGVGLSADEGSSEGASEARRTGGRRNHAKTKRESQQRAAVAPQAVRPGAVGPAGVAGATAKVQQKAGAGDVGGVVEDFVRDRLGGGVAEATARIYNSDWAKWCLWARRHRWVTPFLMGDTKREKSEDEGKLLAFAGYLAWLGSSPATVKRTLFAVQGAHKRAGAGDPLIGAPRLWLLLGALAQERPPAPRKLGVTIPMLEWAKQELAPGPPEKGGARTVEAFNAAVLHAAVLFGFFFLCRAGEYLKSGPASGWEIRGMDVKLSVDCGARRADVQFRKTKADQQAFGCTRTQYEVEAAEAHEVCVVQALFWLKEWAPARFGKGSEAALPLFRWQSNRQVKREQVQATLQRAAEAVGLPKERFKSHSLRIGGASALLHATREFDLVKRFGRWSSDAVHSYLHESAEQYVGLATKMARDRSSVHYT